MNFNFEIEVVGDLTSLSEKIKNDITQDINTSIKTMATSGFEKAQELADKKLSNNIAGIYKKNLTVQQPSENVAIISLGDQAQWIEEGRKPGFMEDLLKNSFKTSKDGTKYRVIPLNSKKNTQSTPIVTENLLNELKSFLEKKNIRTEPTEKLALNKDGSPRVGKIHTFDLKKIRDKKDFSDNIDRINVSQDKNPKTGKIERNITVFRVISEKHKSQGKWNHPGTAPAKILEETYRWVETIWKNEIFPKIKQKYGE